MNQGKLVWKFETRAFAVECYFTPDQDVDVSFDETGETAANLASGLWSSFGTEVVVVHKVTGIELGYSSLWGSIYGEPLDFLSDHRSPDPLNRNSAAMRAVNGDSAVVCHYFPELIRQAVREARKKRRDILTPSLRLP